MAAEMMKTRPRESTILPVLKNYLRQNFEKAKFETGNYEIIIHPPSVATLYSSEAS